MSAYLVSIGPIDTDARFITGQTLGVPRGYERSKKPAHVG